MTDRLTIEGLLDAYIDVLSSASSSATDGFSRSAYNSHLERAQQLLCRWKGGESLAALKTAVETELYLYRSEEHGLAGEAESVGRAFGELCRRVGVELPRKP